MENWTQSQTSDANLSYDTLGANEEIIQGSDIKKVVLERTTEGKLKMIRIDFVV